MEKDLMDLHIHTIYSDGDKSPLEIYNMVKERGMSAFSITDHDTILGSKMLNEMNISDIDFINGVELSLKIDKGQLHILGYDLDLNNENLNYKLNELKINSHKNLKRVLERMLIDNPNIKFSNEDIDNLFKLPRVVNRVDLAKLLIKYNYCNSVNSAFDMYLVDAHNKVRRKNSNLTYKEAIELILNSGGIPVLAHNKSLKLEFDELDKFVKELVDNGLMGIEAYHSSFNNEDVSNSLLLADKYNLLISGGSDYHGKSVKPKVELGNGINNNLKIKQLSLVDYIKRR